MTVQTEDKVWGFKILPTFNIIYILLSWFDWTNKSTFLIIINYATVTKTQRIIRYYYVPKINIIFYLLFSNGYYFNIYHLVKIISNKLNVIYTWFKILHYCIINLQNVFKNTMISIYKLWTKKKILLFVQAQQFSKFKWYNQYHFTQT